MPAKLAAIPPKPNNAAISANTKNIKIHRNISEKICLKINKNNLILL